MPSSTTTLSNDTNSTGNSRQIITIGAFFFIFGFITWVNGTLIPYLRIACELQEWQAYLVTFAFYISYTLMAFPSSKLLEYTGMIKGMRIGLIVMAFGCLLFIPAAYMRSYPLFLIGLFVIGAGTTLLQTTVNPYITLLGPANKAANRMSMMGICNKFAGILAPLILGAIILKNSGGLIQELAQMSPAVKTIRLDELARAVIVPYGILTVALLLVSFLIKYAHLPEIAAAAPTPETANLQPRKPVNHSLNFLLGFIAVFCTVGLEVVSGDTIGNYGLYHGMSLDIAKSLTSYTLAATLAGYLFGVLAIPKIISQEKAFIFSSVLGVAITVLVLIVPGINSVACIAMLGLSNALLWPAIWAQALKGLQGKLLNRASAILIMGIAGGALMPLLYGWLTKSMGNQMAYVILIPCYLFNAFYWYKGREENPVSQGKNDLIVEPFYAPAEK